MVASVRLVSLAAQVFGKKPHDIGIFQKQGRTALRAIIMTSVHLDVPMVAYDGEELSAWCWEHK